MIKRQKRAQIRNKNANLHGEGRAVSAKKSVEESIRTSRPRNNTGGETST